MDAPLLSRSVGSPKSRFVHLRTFALGLALMAAALGSTQTFQPRTWQPAGVDDSADVEGTYVSQTATSVTVRLLSGTNTSLTISGLSDEDKRYLRNVASVTAPYRNWTRTRRDRTGNTSTETFEASLVSILSRDTSLTKRHVVVVRSDTGHRRGYAVADLSPADQSYVNSVATNYPEPPAPNDGAQFAINWTAYGPSSTEPFNHQATDHFVFYWGNTVKPEVANWNNAAFRQMNFAYFERVWNYFKSIGAPMPYDGSSAKKKINVYVTGTGLSQFQDGFAFGGNDIVISPAAMLEGSSVIPHEFGHVIQLYAGGYRSGNDAAINVGWVWESHGNWCSNTFIPGIASALGVYADRSHYELDSSRMNYGSSAWIEHFANHPRFTPSIAFDFWKLNLRNANGDTTETPFQTLMRLGVSRGAFTGNGVQGFGDLIGQMAAHHATWDYQNQQGYVDEVRYLYTQGIPSRSYTLLRPVPDRTGWWRPTYSQAPRQYGVNLIELNVTSGATEVSATLDPIADETIGSNWRATFVAIDANGNARYSRQWRQGFGRMKIKSGEKVMLAIAAAPDTYGLQLFRPGYNVKRRFPYELTFNGCAPVTVPVGIRSRVGISGSAHPNGGGFVASSATVAATAYVGPNAQVLDAAQVQGSARIEDNATIGGSAVISGSAVVGGYAYVRENAKVKDNARVGEYALIQQAATIGGNARVREFVNVQGDGTIAGDAMVKGFGDVFTSPNAAVGGGTIIGQDSEIYFGDYNAPINFGTLYGYANRGLGLATSTADGAASASDVRTDNKYLYAHWSFTKPRNKVLIDDLTDNDGVLRNGAVFGTNGSRSVLKTNGTGAYAAIEGHALDAAGITIDMQIYCRGGATNQSVISFTGPGGNIRFTPRNASNRAVFTVVSGSTTQTVTASQAVPNNAWHRVTIIYTAGSVKIYLNGTQIASSTAVTIAPSSLKATAGYLGCSPTLGNTFNGDFYDVAIYRKAFANYAGMVPPYTR